MQLQDQLETQEYGYARSRIAMELINGQAPRSQYAGYLDSDPVLVQISSHEFDESYLIDQISNYYRSG